MKVRSTKPGSASAVKVLRSVLIKGVEALAIESFVAARRQGLLEEVMGCLGDIDAGTFAGSLAMLTQTHIVHAHRRWEEMGLVAQTLRDTGVEPLMTEAIACHRSQADDGDEIRDMVRGWAEAIGERGGLELAESFRTFDFT